MLTTSTVAAILAFCSLSSAKPLNRKWEPSGSANTGSAVSYTTADIPGTATGWPHHHETSSTSSYYSSLSYAHSASTAVDVPECTASPDSGDSSSNTGSSGNAGNSGNSGGSGDSTTTITTTVASGPATPTGLSKVAQILLSDTRADAINNVLKDDADFVFDFNKARKFGPGAGGEVVQANRKAFPALTGTGIGMAVGFLGPCGFNTPHVHNRATELLIVTKGRVVSEMVVENGVEDADKKPRDITNTLEELQATPYFMGALHTQYNPDCGNVTFVAPLSSEDFGANTMAQAYFALEDDTIRAAAGNQITGADVDKFRGIISTNVALGVEQCLKKCNIPKSS
ncbi:RmlC-like cupin domain-containing protein [Hypoxylon rubiginosum]|uniref:RmlC-like cupin domain-containing protein n=1 Tax=Hypoxylon rubiginosum TaxID=110542 RepID=A0ACC0D514_9PEZI|nr:RmlC-like cupin domain-containing protein [Hypoxylon rubiginosum]